MLTVTAASGFGGKAPGQIVTIPTSDFWNGSQLSSFTIGTGTINRNTTNNDQRRWVYSDPFGGDYNVDLVLNAWAGHGDQAMVGWFRSSDLASFDDDENYARPMRVANSQGFITKDGQSACLLNENATDQSADTTQADDLKITFRRVGSVITVRINDSLHDTSALTNTADIRLMYGAYNHANDGGGIDGIVITSDTVG